MSNVRGPLSVRKKLAFTIVSVVGFFLILEAVLAAIGVRPWYLVHDPNVGFQPGSPLFLSSGGQWRTNPAKLAYFNDQSFPVQKKPRTYRVFCLGGSTTFGHPYDYRTSFSNWLKERLRDADPSREWEVINCGGISYASYRVRLLMEELCQYEPDLFIIYSGQNEFLEKRTYGDSLRGDGWRARLESGISRTRTATVIASLVRPAPPATGSDRSQLAAEVDTILDNSVGPSEYHRDELWRDGVVSHFRESLGRMCGLARVSGARVILVTPASNVRDFSPFKSEHGKIGARAEAQWEALMSEARAARDAGDATTAAERYLAAVKLDPLEARGHWEAARALLAAGRVDEAREHFTLSVDEDVCPLRATSAIREAISDVASRERVPLIDFPRLLAEQRAGGDERFVLGDESFLDHVHPTIDGHQVLAWKLYDQLAEWGVAPPQTADESLKRRVGERVMADIDSRAQALAVVQVVQVLSWGGKNDEALQLVQRAEQLHPGLSDVASYRGRLLEKLGRDQEAYAEYQEAIRRNPTDSLALSRAGWAALKQEQYVDARAFFATAIVHMPPHAPTSFRAATRFGMGMAFLNLQQREEAKLEFEATLELAPGHEEARAQLEQLGKQGSPAGPPAQK